METIITIILLTISALGLLTSIGLFIGFIATNRTDTDVYLTDYEYECDCGCNQKIPEAGWCSSECDEKCQANNHYEWNN